jgi:hypothetical protein
MRNSTRLPRYLLKIHKMDSRLATCICCVVDWVMKSFEIVECGFERFERREESSEKTV